MIAFRNVTVRYGRAPRDALRRVSLDAVPGTLTAVVGPNGSGKSTLVRALLARIPVGTGSILIDGHERGTLGGRDFARRVATVTQREETLFPRIVREYLALGRLPHRHTPGAAQGEDAVARAAERASIVPLLDRRTDELSGGEWQRVRIARALAQDARALVLDEPTTFLDVAHQMAVFELLASLAGEGHAVLLVSHELNLVARFASHVVLLDAGEVAAAGAPDDVMRGPVLERVYGWPLVVSRDPAVGAPALVPLRRRG